MLDLQQYKKTRRLLWRLIRLQAKIYGLKPFCKPKPASSAKLRKEMHWTLSDVSNVG